jgi:hypothetical protein
MWMTQKELIWMTRSLNLFRFGALFDLILQILVRKSETKTLTIALSSKTHFFWCALCAAIVEDIYKYNTNTNGPREVHSSVEDLLFPSLVPNLSLLSTLVNFQRAGEKITFLCIEFVFYCAVIPNGIYFNTSPLETLWRSECNTMKSQKVELHFWLHWLQVLRHTYTKLWFMNHFWAFVDRSLSSFLIALKINLNCFALKHDFFSLRAQNSS